MHRIQTHSAFVQKWVGYILLLLVVINGTSSRVFAQGTINDSFNGLRAYPAAPINLPTTDDKSLMLSRLLFNRQVQLSADALGRASIFFNDVRLADFAKGNFLPSAIPAAGEPYFGVGSRAGMVGNGSAVGISAAIPSGQGNKALFRTQISVDSYGTATSASLAGNVSIRQAWGQYNRWRIGVMESAFADAAAVPETLDVAGPNARVSIYDAGQGDGQARLSFNVIDSERSGFTLVTSVEQPQPEIVVTTTSGTWSKAPDFICTGRYLAGDMVGEDFVERWHVQWGSIVRSLGLEDDANTYRDDRTGWGTSLSGSYRFRWNPCLRDTERFAFSATYGEGIAHYIVDTNNMTAASDASRNAAGTLSPLPLFAWYVGYTHPWTDRLRSTVTYSQVDLNSFSPLGAPAASPYRTGRYLGVNLLYHREFVGEKGLDGKQPKYTFFTGLEYLFGRKETLNGSDGNSQQIMWTTAIMN